SPGKKFNKSLLPNANCDQRNGTPRQFGINSLPQPNEPVKPFQLPSAERFSSEEAPAHVPGRPGNPITHDDLLNLQASLFHLLAQIGFRVAAKMAQCSVNRGKDFLPVWRQNYRTPTWAQRRVNVSQTGQIVFYVFQYIKADDRIHLSEVLF